MGFALWMEPELAIAAGTYEYRAMGVAILSETDLFRPADFRRNRRPPPVTSPTFAGHFASIAHVNAYLLARRSALRRGRRARQLT